MADRAARIVMLLETRLDHLWLPPGSLRTQSGLAPADRRPCTTCGGVEIRDDFGKQLVRRKGRGKVRDRFKHWQRCPTCNGDGWTARDRMDSKRVVLGSTETSSSARPRKTVLCDGCGGDGVRFAQPCPYCAGLGRRDLHVFDLAIDTTPEGGADPVAAAIDRRDKSGSYHELDLALDELLMRHRRVWAATVSLHGPLLDLGVRFVDDRMPDPILVPGDVRANATMQRDRVARLKGRGTDARALEQRNRQAVAWVREGRPFPWVRAELGLSDRQLRRIIAGDDSVAA